MCVFGVFYSVLRPGSRVVIAFQTFHVPCPLVGERFHTFPITAFIHIACPVRPWFGNRLHRRYYRVLVLRTKFIYRDVFVLRACHRPIRNLALGQPIERGTGKFNGAVRKHSPHSSTGTQQLFSRDPKRSHVHIHRPTSLVSCLYIRSARA